MLSVDLFGACNNLIPSESSTSFRRKSERDDKDFSIIKRRSIYSI